MENQYDRAKRGLYLRNLAAEAVHEVFCSIAKKHSTKIFKELNIVGKVDERAIDDAVNYYYDGLLIPYKERYLENGQKAGRDKGAAFTAIALLTFNPIQPFEVAGQFVDVELINETLALRYAQIVLDVDFDRCNDGKKLSDDELRQEQDRQDALTKNLLQNLRELGVTARDSGRKGVAIHPVEPLSSWVIQSMQLLALAYGNIDFGVSEAD